ncbi:hypothetical protein F2P81_004193 [Scophthalmus maximus]|uniref:Uncharacterized protein n=1 Tax=Scophthalmus maximus TaxID=52904 RepID=A0A6A4T5J8_SCOMX|nr:hypothetical protein F2P81_004193 [Scophthalmus maximus]
MQERQDVPLGTLRPQTRCLRCGDALEWSEEHSVPLGCSCCATADEALEKVARGLASKMRRERSHWAAGRVGDIDFTGASKKRGKFMRVRSDTDPVLIYRMLTEEWGLAPPHLVVALVGGDELTQMKPWLRDTLRKGLVKAAQSTGAGSFEIPVLCLLVHGEPRILKSQEAQDFLDELKLAVAWNRVDIAKSDIFNGDVDWKARDLEEVMMDALINDKPDFVRLFVDNGVNLGDFLTYGRLQELYWSVSEKSLLHNLLLKKYEEKQLLLGAARAPGPPGHHPAEQGKPRFTLFEEKPAKGRLFHTQKNLPELEERCEHPWRDLFLWAVLQNRQQMANYFWAMGPEAVAAALAGCKILKEMARLESEAESARSMKEAKYEQFALDVFGECYSNSEDRAYALLVRRTRCWSKSTVLNLATEADAKSFFAHDGVQEKLLIVIQYVCHVSSATYVCVLTRADKPPRLLHP